MRSSTGRAFATAFAMAFFGWLAAGALRVTNEWVYLAALVVGTLAGAASRRAVAVVAVGLGILAAYPVALLVGLIAFLGDGWLFAVFAIQLVAATGFLAGVAWTTRRPATGDVPAE